MNNIATTENHIPAMSELAINNVRQLEELVLKVPQIKIPTNHLFHAGVYARTIMIPAGVILTGALIKIATVLVVSGDVIVYMGEKTKELHGYGNVLAASGGRKQAFVAITDTYLTMIFATKVKSVEAAEDEFTDEANLLFSRAPDAVNYIMKGN